MIFKILSIFKGIFSLLKKIPIKNFSDHKFYRFEFDDRLLKVIWFAESKNMTVEDFKLHQKLQTNIIIERSYKYMLVNSLDFAFPISPDIQKWLDETQLKKAANYGLKRIAILVPTDLFSGISVEQTMSSDVAKQFSTAYFKDEMEAKAWLFEEEI